MTSPHPSEPAGTPIRVAMLRWPDDADQRAELAARRLPRLLVVGAGAVPPPVEDELEDWIRDPLDGAEVVARVETLRARARRMGRPTLEDGILWYQDRWAVVPAQQQPVVELLLGELNAVVRTADLRAAYVRAGGGGHDASVRTMLNRVRARCEQVGLTLHFIRGRGVLLEATPRRIGGPPRTSL